MQHPLFLVIFGAHVNVLFIYHIEDSRVHQIITCLKALVYIRVFVQMMRERSDVAPLSCQIVLVATRENGPLDVR